MKFKVSLTIMSLLIIISISSFLWANSLIKAVENGYATQSQIARISLFGLNSVLYKKLNTLTEDDRIWRNIAKKLAETDGDVAFKLAKYYIAKQSESKQSKSKEHKRNIQLWLTQAVRLKHHEASLLLAKIYFEEDKFKAAKKILLPLESDAFALKLLIEISMSTGDLKETKRYVHQFKALHVTNQNDEFQLFFQKLINYQVINKHNQVSATNCLASIAPFATNLQNLTYFEKLISSPTLSSLRPYLCFSQVKYISKVELDCLHAETEAIRCSESIWDKRNNLADNNRFVAVLVEKGGANVNSGILYIDSNDTEDVLFHELAHLLGFIDEYPLPKYHYRCLAVQKSMFSHNIAILPRYYQGSREVVRSKILKELPWAKYISNSTPLVSRTARGWKLGTGQGEVATVGAFIAESCDETDFVAIKPLNQRTKMRYFEENFPALYLQMLADSPEKFLMPRYLENVMIALGIKK